MSDSYDGPHHIAYADFPGKGISYWVVFEGRSFDISFSEKRRKMRVFVDGDEWVKRSDVEPGG